MSLQTFMKYGLQKLMGLQTFLNYGLQNSDGPANLNELWAPYINRPPNVLWAVNINRLANF